MPLINDPDGLSQGGLTSPTSIEFKSASGANITIDANGNGDLPSVTANDYIEIRNANTTANNGLYRVSSVTTRNEEIVLVKGALDGSVVNPANDAANTNATTLGTNADYWQAGEASRVE